MKFCTNCGTVLKLDPEKKLLTCSKCGTEEPAEDDIVMTRNKEEQDKIVVLGKKERNLRTTPQTKAKCPKCGNTMAYWWMVQTRGIDESATQFFRCTKCAHTWRDYG
ncbi:MAG: transcription factor S [Candidatus Bathyarchaeota archaeon]|nr:MAG: transcription factor S [Candidatus Bathyarchaeota archaeon]